MISGNPVTRRTTTREAVVVAAVLMVLTVGFFPDVVLGGRTLSTSALGRGVMGKAPPYQYSGPKPKLNRYLLDPLASRAGSEPVAEKVSTVWRRGSIPLWDRNIGLGRPLLAAWHTEIVSPVRLPISLWPSPAMWDLLLLARFVVAGFFTYLLAKRLRLVRIAAGGAAVAYMFSGYFMLYVNMPHADFAMTIPIVLYAVDLVAEAPTGRRILACSVAVAIGILSDNPETAAVLLLFASAYAVIRVVAERARGARARALGSLAIGVAAGVGLTAFILVPFFELTGFVGFEPLSVHRHTGEAALGLRHHSVPIMLSLFVPYFHGPPVQNLLGNSTTGMYTYAGVVAPLLGFLGLWNRRAMRAAGWFFLGAAVVLLAKSYGNPLVNWIGGLPFFEQVAFGQYTAPAIGLCAAMLAGAGIDQIARREVRTAHVVASAAAVAGIVGLLVLANDRALRVLPPQHMAAQMRLAAALGAVATLCALIAARARGAWAPRIAAAVAALVVVELFVFTAPTKASASSVSRALLGNAMPAARRPVRHDPFTIPPYVSFLRMDRAPYRVVGFEGILYPKTASAFDIDDLRSFTAAAVERYSRLVREFVDPSVQLRLINVPHRLLYAPREGAGMPDQRWFFDLLNVKYMLSRNSNIERLSGGRYELAYDGEIRIYRNTTVLPRAFLVHRAVIAPDADRAVAFMKDPGFDPSRLAVVEGALPAAQRESLRAAPHARTGRVSIDEHGDGRVRLTVRTPQPALLVLSDTYYPGWRARIDGAPVRVHPTDVALRSVYVGAGTHTVTFTYSPTSFKAGAVTSASVLATLVAYALWDARRRRRTALPAPTEDAEPDVSRARAVPVEPGRPASGLTERKASGVVPSPSGESEDAW